MTHLSQLPTEIILVIYHRLDNIDDVLRLGRSCRRAHVVLNSVAHRLSIFRSIICSATHHKHDLRLYQLWEAQKHFATGSPEELSSPSASKRRNPPCATGSESVCDKFPVQLPYEEVWEVICRWHGMKVLYELYSDRVIQLCYFLSVPSFSPLDESEEFADAVANEGFLPQPSSFSKKNALQLSTMQKQRAYQRFYKALTAHWVAVESLCLAKAADYQTSSQRNCRLKNVWDIWTNNAGRTLLEKLEVLEVTDFIWDFLGRKIFQGVDAPSKWLAGGSENLLSYHTDEQYTEQENWLHFIRDVAQYLRPPHFIELLLLAVWDTRSSGRINRSAYLQGLGFSRMGAVQQVDEINQTQDFFPLAVLEEDVVNELIGGEGSMARKRKYCQLRWDQYRCERWVHESRTKILLREENSDQIFNSIMG